MEVLGANHTCYETPNNSKDVKFHKKLFSNGVEKKNTKLDSKLQSENTNKSSDFVQKEDNMYTDRQNMNFRMLQEAAKNEDSHVLKFEEEKHQARGRSSPRRNFSIEPESSEDEPNRLEKSENEIEIISKPVKHHGCMWPLHPYQVCTWLIAAIDFYFVFSEVMPYMTPIPVFILVLVLLFTITPALLYLDIKLCFSDPTDPVVYDERLKMQYYNRANNDPVSEKAVKISKLAMVDTRDYDSTWIYV
jgi:hypothetical protein